MMKIKVRLKCVPLDILRETTRDQDNKNKDKVRELESNPEDGDLETRSRFHGVGGMNNYHQDKYNHIGGTM